MLSFHWRVQGTPTMRKALESRRAQAWTAARRGLRQEGEAIMTASKLIVPWEQGTLARSGFTGPVTQKGSALTVTIGYGGMAADYAVVQHENLFFRHTPGRFAKYLETPATKAMQTFEQRLGQTVRVALEKG